MPKRSNNPTKSGSKKSKSNRSEKRAKNDFTPEFSKPRTNKSPKQKN